jgi:phage baseplate assembly protein gpV
MLEVAEARVEVAQHVTQTGGDLLALEIAAQHQHGDVGAQGQPFTHAGEL